MPEPGCEAVGTAGPTIHEAGDIDGEVVWSAAASPHIVRGTINVRSGAKLMIEPCVEVLMAEGHSINVAYPLTPNSGTLIAEGTDAKPIRIVGEDGARWGSVSARAGATVRLAHVTLENGGGGRFEHGATLAVYGDAEDGADEMIHVDHVTIAKSLGVGAWLSSGATFHAGSRDLVIAGSGNEVDPYPLQIEEHAIDRVPSGTYTGNVRDEILIYPAGGRTSGSGLLADATMRDHGVPYRIGASIGHSLIIGGRSDDKLVTLTVEAGVVMKFEKGAALKVQHYRNLDPSNAALRVLGTATDPVVMTSAAAAPAPGDWVGISYGGKPDETNVIDHARIEFAGGDCGCVLSTCSNIIEHEAAIILSAPTSQSFITNTAFSQIAGHGVLQGFDGAFVDFRPTNTFDVAGCSQTLPRMPGTCPAPRPACDGME